MRELLLLDYTKYYAQLQSKQNESSLEKVPTVPDEEETMEFEMQEVSLVPG
jgi:hypothetical protein